MFLTVLLVCAAWLVCYIKCKQLRPRVDVEIVGGGGLRLGPGSAGLHVSEPEPGWPHTPWSGLVPVRAGCSVESRPAHTNVITTQATFSESVH